MKDIAKEYASKGYRVLYLYGAYRSEDGTMTCSCPQPDNTKFSHGKHPLFGSHGSRDATLDPAVIDAWPDGPMALGWGLSDTNVAIDIDDEGITAQLLDPEYGLRDIATVTTTGRGLHILLQCAPTKNGVLKRKDTREKIGEVRADGYYVVLPPSLHMNGRNYSYLGASLLHDGPTKTHLDGWGYARELLAPLGIEIVDKNDIVSVPRDGVEILPVELPFDTDSGKLKSLLLPSYPSTDRSAALFLLACEMVREMREKKLTVARHLLAGVLKQVDIERGKVQSKGSKYAWRHDADDYYWDAIVEAEQAVDNDDAATATQAARGTYYVDPATGDFIDNSNPQAPQRVMNFGAEISEELEVWTDEGHQSTDWVIRVWQDGLEKTIRLTKSQLGMRQFVQAFSEELSANSAYIVEHGKWPKVQSAIQHYSKGRVKKNRVYADTGWVYEQDAFLLPGLPGAITPHGIDMLIKYDLEGGDAIKRMHLYGKNMAPPSPNVDLAMVARTLFGIAPSYISVPLITQVLASPLASLAFEKDALITHLFSRTGTFKTSMARVAMSLYGSFLEGQVDTWTATANALSGTMFRLRDLPMLIDDFKRSMSPQAVTNLIQNYADRTTRTRQNRTQGEQRSLVPRCLAISTGEEIWGSHESARARTLLVDIGRTTTLEMLIPAQQLAKDGRLQMLGYAWLEWLTRQGQDTLRRRMESLREDRMEVARKTDLGQSHARIVASISSLLSVDKLFEEFVAERIPAFLEEYRDLRSTGWVATIKATQEHAELAEELSPYNLVRSAILNALETDTVKLRGWRQGDDSVGGFAGEIVGFLDDKHVYVNEGITLGWYKKLMKQQGEEATMTWESFTQEASRDHQAIRPNSPMRVSVYKTSLRMLLIPRSEFFQGVVEGAISTIQEEA